MTKPQIPPGLYRWPTGRVYSADELTVVWRWFRWHVVPKGVKQ